MKAQKLVGLAAASLLATAPLVACENLPGTREEQATVIGGAVGALAGAQMNETNPMFGALLGGALGAGGGYLIGAKTDWFSHRDQAADDARRSVQIAQDHPATVEDVRRSSTADLNNDGFVTADELVAMDRAGLSDSQMIDRLERTNQVFDLSPGQERALRDAGVSSRVIAEMRNINRDDRDRLLRGSGSEEPLGRPRY